MAAATLRSFTTGTANGTAAGLTYSVNKPAGVVSGDLLLAYHYTDESGVESQMTGPSGWTVIGTKSDLQIAGAGVLKIWQKIASASEPANYTFGIGCNGVPTDGQCAILAFTTGTYGSTTPTTTPSFGGNGTVDGSSVAPSVAGVVDGLLLCSFHIQGGNMTWTPPSGMTEQVDFKSVGSWTATEIASLVLTSTAATGTKTATATGSTGADLSSSLVVVPSGPATLNKTKMGATTVAKAYVGSAAVSKMYVGATQVFP